MSGTSPIILILGAGAHIGLPVARMFAAKSYKVALAARSLKESDSTEDQLNITCDFSDPENVVHAFTRVKKELGIPSVVLYNAGSLTFAKEPFEISLDAKNRDMAINHTSAFVAAQQAVLGFAELPAHAAKTFLFTGNILNVKVLSGFMGQGTGKSASAHMIAQAAEAYKDRGYKFAIPIALFRFYYVDERKADGSAKYKVDGEAHGKHFLELAEASTQGPWLQTFVKDVGYQDFSSLYKL
ncbi:3-oxoacyl-[acyl-carrier-protein] reductase FabG [Lachnellula suecica]|uniref:3-oxoacyl-[acyl-carrier-protein] reductase FabG n=1 Tax=Lachnellula suecica TaxID=602035 RepID=A0A8T9C526_9HELO|nr:3-oxoacyl-[acyl-carrier-protein] reductase FabG [Lachnellula suecica]